MKTYLLCLVSFFALCGVSNAALTNCNPPAAGQIVVQAPLGSSAFMEVCGPLTINAFMLVNGGATSPVTVTLANAQYDPMLGFASLSFNPNFSAPAGTTMDLDLYFTVTGGINGIDLATGGSNSTIVERACSTPILITAGNTCTGGLANQLALLTSMSGQANQIAFFSPPNSVSPVYIFKDVLTDGRLSTNGAGLTSFSQSFEFTSVPEPMSFGLMGVGLVAMGLLRRKSRRA